MNCSLCETCRRLVPARVVRRGGTVFLRKQCPSCGSTEAVISKDAARYGAKHLLDAPRPGPACDLNCLDCAGHRSPNCIVLDVTNRCNLDCPICVDRVPEMGFVFEPPVEYFERLFAQSARRQPRVVMELSGGEPTMRDDLFEIIGLSQSHGFTTHAVTNGLKLADEEYCRRLIESGVTILLSYDSANPETYRRLRGDAGVLEVKRKALDNIARTGGAKVFIMAVIARGLNDGEVPELMEFCHQQRGFVRRLQLFPLARTCDDAWPDGEPDRITSGEVEALVEECLPGEGTEFVPAGIQGRMGALMHCLGMRPWAYAGAHPDCESACVVFSDGDRFVPVSRFLRGSTPEVARELVAVGERLERLLAGDARGARAGTGPRTLPELVATALLGPRLVGKLKLAELLRGRGIGKLAHALSVPIELARGRTMREVLARHTRLDGVAEVFVMPLQDDSAFQTERLRRCPVTAAFLEPADELLRFVPTCAWRLHNAEALRRVADHYGRA